jgi:hypothetical protein
MLDDTEQNIYVDGSVKGSKWLGAEILSEYQAVKKAFGKGDLTEKEKALFPELA